mmetsp:Transcript_14223/g.25717  ORF Transcript_14223/g.25717 Transcript_14223/m.25717 type:complete len:117 (+) Transcript_14223:1-351(+)
MTMPFPSSQCSIYSIQLLGIGDCAPPLRVGRVGDVEAVRSSSSSSLCSHQQRSLNLCRRAARDEKLTTTAQGSALKHHFCDRFRNRIAQGNSALPATPPLYNPAIDVLKILVREEQ